MKTKKPREKKTPDAVMAEVEAKVPGLAIYIEADRDWLWYCGPSLAGSANKAKREALKEIGFRFAKNGHETERGSLGSWGHACLHPIPFKRRRGVEKRRGGEKEETSSIDDLLAAL